MKKLNTLLALSFLCFSTTLSAEIYYKMWCRSPLPIEIVGEKTTLKYWRNPVISGYSGKDVLPGKCALTDRPFRDGEPGSIIAEDWPVKTHQLLVSSATKKGLLLQFHVYRMSHAFIADKRISVIPALD